jgi:uncharacterized membrane protein YjgN (DUF898 family)
MVNKITYDGKLGQLYKIWLVNLIFAALTLGIHGFWGRTRMRKYLARCLSLGGDRFEYTGKGSELFKAFLKVIGLFLGLGALYFTTHYVAHHVLEMPIIMTIIDFTLAIIYLPVIFFLTYVALYGATRYRLSKTRWRGIRFALSGSSYSYALFALGQSVLSLITCGLLILQTLLKRQKKIINNISYGNLSFTMDYSQHNLNKINIITLLLAIPTLMLSRVWFHIALNKFVYDHVKLGDIRFKYTMTPGRRIGLAIISLLILIITLGFGTPIIVQIHLRAIVDTMEIIGDLKSLKTTQSKNPDLKSGEGLESVLGEGLMV